MKENEGPKMAENCIERSMPVIVAVAAGIVMMIVYGMTFTSGIFYVEFLDEFNHSRGGTAWVSSLIVACGYGISPLSGILVNKFGCRITMILAGLLMAIGLCTSVFAQDVYVLFLTYGVITGIGCGLTYVPATTIVCMFHQKRRSLALGIVMSCSGLGTVAFPPLLRYLLAEYGWRGTFLLCGGISLNVCVAGCVMRTPSKNPLKNKSCEVNPVKANHQEGTDSFLLKNISFYVICLNNTLFCFAASIVMVHLIAFANEKPDVSEEDATNLIPMIGITMLVGRLAHGILAQHPMLKPLYIYTLSFAVGGMATLAVPLLTNYVGILIYAGIFGLNHAALGGALLPCTLVDIAGLERLPVSLGIAILYEAVGQILGAPVAGFMYDSFQSYNPSFYLGGSLVILSALILIYPICNTCREPTTDLEEAVISRSLIQDHEIEKEIVMETTTQSPQV